MRLASISPTRPVTAISGIALGNPGDAASHASLMLFLHRVINFLPRLLGFAARPANAFLHFNHAHDFARNAVQRFTGGVVEYSTNNGATWNDTAALYMGNGYNGTISGGTGNPLAGRKAFTSTSYGYISSRLNLSSLAGQNVRFRFRITSDTSVARADGWNIDDVLIRRCN